MAILLSAGHWPKATGAQYGEVKEHDLAVEWVSELAAMFEAKRELVLLVPTGPLAVYKDKKMTGGKVFWINAQARPGDLALEVHFNSDAAHKGKGSETLYCPKSARGKTFARAIQSELGKIFPPDRGAAEGWLRRDRPGVVDYAGDVEGDEHVAAFLVDTKCTALILEPEFIHNVNIIREKKVEACGAIVRSVMAAFSREVK